MKGVQVEFAKEETVAEIICMPVADFLLLVEKGHLPKPRDIGGHKRWDMEEVRRIIRGDGIDGMGDVEW